jgi:hypothetical protein
MCRPQRTLAYRLLLIYYESSRDVEGSAARLLRRNQGIDALSKAKQRTRKAEGTKERKSE